MKIEFSEKEWLWIVVGICLIVVCFICADCEKTKIKSTGKPDISITQ